MKAHDSASGKRQASPRAPQLRRHEEDLLAYHHDAARRRLATSDPLPAHVRHCDCL